MIRYDDASTSPTRGVTSAGRCRVDQGRGFGTHLPRGWRCTQLGCGTHREVQEFSGGARTHRELEQ
jgi:hypothetical protein